MNKSPAFQFYAAEWLVDENVQLMTLEEEGAYIHLLAFCWREGSIPADVESMARLCKGASEKVLAVVVRCFKKGDEAGRLIHPRLEAERAKQEAFKKQMSRAGKAGMRKRWAKK